MRLKMGMLIAGAVALCLATTALGQGLTPGCPARPMPGTVVQDEPSLFSQNGVLTVDLSLRTSVDPEGYAHYCYDYIGNQIVGPQIVEAPTLRLNPGDTLVMNLKNDLPSAPGEPMADSMNVIPPPGYDSDCHGGMITVSTTNVHFHGLNVPPICHQDDVINTLIQPGDPPFQYRIQIPPNDPPGLYWYHPHPHGYATVQVNGGAAGALIIEGMEKLRPEVAGLKERVFVIREQVLNPTSWIPGPYQMTINFQQAITPAKKAPIIQIKPQEKQFWRVVNASTQLFLALQLSYGGEAQTVELIAMDGVPLKTPLYVKTIPLTPAGRAEFVIQGPTSDQSAVFQTLAQDTGPAGNPNVFQVIANIFTTDTPDETPHAMPAVIGTSGPQRFSDLLEQKPTTERHLYFSEATGGINGPTKYYLTIEGQRPEVFMTNEKPKIVTHIGAVEDWTIENHAQENHDFHIHQIHFLVMEINGKPVKEPYLGDSITVPYWPGVGPFPRVKLRMDFRDPEIAGTFVYHCHILDHEDGGMMAKIQVDPK